MKVAIVGGHLTPALAVIDTLPKEAEIIFIGRKYVFEGDTNHSLEYTVITEKNIPFIPLITGKIQRKFTIHTLKSFYKIPYGLSQAIQILRKNKPDVVIGFGGYLSVPVGVAAYILRIPLVIHEQTLEAGLGNKFLARFAKKVCISWRQSIRFFPHSKAILTGNPIRKFPKVPVQFEISKEHMPFLYVTGGSAGSHDINQFVEANLELFLKKTKIIHQTGDASQYHDYERLVSLRKSLPTKLQNRYVVTKFIKPYEVGAVMHEATLIVSRSGMNTTTELLSLGKPCFLIPLPYGQKNEQLTNARFLKKVGIGDFVEQQELNPEKFYRHIEMMLENIGKYQVHEKDAQSLIHEDAAQKIVSIIYEVISKKS